MMAEQKSWEDFLNNKTHLDKSIEEENNEKDLDKSVQIEK